MHQLGGILLCLLQRDHVLAPEGGMRARAFSLCFGDAARGGWWLCRVREVLVGIPSGPAFPAADGRQAGWLAAGLTDASFRGASGLDQDRPRAAVGSFPACEAHGTAEAGGTHPMN